MESRNPDEGRPIPRPGTRAGAESVDPARVWGVVAVALGLFLTVAGVMHFATPSFFDAIVPPWLWPSERFWTLISGIAELIVGPMLLIPRTRRWGAIAAVALFIVVYPANLYMVWDWRDRSFAARVVSWARLPFQFVFIWLAWKVATETRRLAVASS